jgi:hypothetical protein
VGIEALEAILIISGPASFPLPCLLSRISIFLQIYVENPCSSHLLLIHLSKSAGHWIGEMKIEIKFDRQDIEEIAGGPDQEIAAPCRKTSR